MVNIIYLTIVKGQKQKHKQQYAVWGQPSTISEQQTNTQLTACAPIPTKLIKQLKRQK